MRYQKKLNLSLVEENKLDNEVDEKKLLIILLLKKIEIRLKLENKFSNKVDIKEESEENIEKEYYKNYLYKHEIEEDYKFKIMNYKSVLDEYEKNEKLKDKKGFLFTNQIMNESKIYNLKNIYAEESKIYLLLIKWEETNFVAEISYLVCERENNIKNNFSIEIEILIYDDDKGNIFFY